MYIGCDTSIVLSVNYLRTRMYIVINLTPLMDTKTQIWISDCDHGKSEDPACIEVLCQQEIVLVKF